LLKNRIFSGLGSSLEWFDFALYGYFGNIFSKVFFSHANSKTWEAILATYLIFFIGFAARPVGALIFGYIGDKFGRVISLRITPVLITLTTIMLACLPTYHAVGNFAILLLALTRIIQGILIGGEFAGNIVYLCESTKKWKYLLGSLASCSGSLGIILASLVASIFYSTFSTHFMYTNGWRLAFLLSVPIGLTAFFIRLKMTESEEFSKKRASKNPFLITIKHYKKKLLLLLGLICLHATSFYFVFMFLPVFLTKVRHFPESAALFKNTAFLILHLLCIPVFGFLVNYIGGLRATLI
jgi:MFS transporter, MHS family, proline/betaine transporter